MTDAERALAALYPFDAPAAAADADDTASLAL